MTALELAERFHLFPIDHPSYEYCQGIKTKQHDPSKCNERGKHPMCKWSDWSTQDPERLNAKHYFGGGPRNIGIDCGKSGILVIDEDAEAEFEHLCAWIDVEVPVTFTVNTGRGRHFYFRQPPGEPLGNQEGTLKGLFKINVRGAGGYVVAPGSLHATGVIYEVIDDTDPIEVPDWLIKALSGRGPGLNGDTGLTDPSPPPKDNEWWREGPIPEGKRHDAIVAAAGWSRRMGLHLNEARPIIRDVLSRCIGGKYTLDEAYGRLEDVYDRYKPGGRLEERRSDTEADDDDLASWDEVDLTDALAGHKIKTAPTILKRSDGRHLFYEGQINYLHGSDSVGKSFVALFAAVEILDAGGHVVWLDWEDPDETTIVARLLDLGIDPQVANTRFHYHHPETEATPAAIAKVCGLIKRHHARLVVVDSVGEALGIDGVNEDKDSEVTPWFRWVLRPLAATGAAVLPIDHGIKSGDNPLWPSGSKRKRAMVTGASYLVEAPRPISKEFNGGQLKLTCAKDRHGNFTRGKAAAIIDVAIHNGRWTVTVHPMSVGDETSENDRTLAHAMTRAVHDLTLELGRAPTLTQCEQSKRVKAGVQAKRAALEYAVAVGALREDEGPRKSRLFIYMKDIEFTTPSDPVSTPSDGVTNTNTPTPSPRPSLWGRGRDGVDGEIAEGRKQPSPSDGVDPLGGNTNAPVHDDSVGRLGRCPDCDHRLVFGPCQRHMKETTIDARRARAAEAAD